MSEPVRPPIVKPKIPARYEHAKWEDVPENIQALFLAIPKTHRGLYIHGAVGTGKTHVAYTLYREAREKAPIWVPEASSWSGDEKRWRETRPLFWNTTELFREMRLDFDRHRESKESPEERVMENDGILFLDDIGAEKVSDWVMENFYLIINKYYNERRPIIFTSNLTIEQLAKTISDRIASRIVETCDVVELKGGDRRLKKPVDNSS